MLKLQEVNCFYGKSHVLHNVSFEVKEGELVGLVGRNGVGKSTTLKAIMGLVPPKTATIWLDDVNLCQMKDYRIPRNGIAYVPQGRHLFPKLTVLENLKIPIVEGEPDAEVMREVFNYFPVLEKRLGQKAGTLSGGEQQMLALGRALITRPKLILMDEPTEGLMPILAKLIFDTVGVINEKGTAGLLVEQNLKNLKGICHRIYIMEKGSIVYEGTYAELEGAVDIQERYLSVKV